MLPKGYCINLDVDEYLVASENNLLNFLDSRLQYPAPGAILLNDSFAFRTQLVTIDQTQQEFLNSAIETLFLDTKETTNI